MNTHRPAPCPLQAPKDPTPTPCAPTSPRAPLLCAPHTLPSPAQPPPAAGARRSCRFSSPGARVHGGGRRPQRLDESRGPVLTVFGAQAGHVGRAGTRRRSEADPPRVPGSRPAGPSRVRTCTAVLMSPGTGLGACGDWSGPQPTVNRRPRAPPVSRQPCQVARGPVPELFRVGVAHVSIFPSFICVQKQRSESEELGSGWPAGCRDLSGSPQAQVLPPGQQEERLRHFPVQRCVGGPHDHSQMP
ncbi:translation initiation factor IF-2-like [Moschus berezovskii]|uniref:translation initiation factor IF-2-like n=1 Tax=Moschus berezovskii TaxID=68408 RepID=UPI0024437722|nr:translation initiation factor IF-2-like [Moschus berezovskii]